MYQHLIEPIEYGERSFLLHQANDVPRGRWGLGRARAPALLEHLGEDLHEVRLAGGHLARVAQIEEDRTRQRGIPAARIQQALGEGYAGHGLAEAEVPEQRAIRLRFGVRDPVH